MVGRLFIISWLGLFGIVAGASPKAAKKDTKTPGMGINVTTIADRWDQVLNKYVDAKTGQVDYVGLEGSGKSDLEALLSFYSALDLTKLSDDERKATYINLYNAGMMYNVLRYVREKEKFTVSDNKFLDVEINNIKVPGGNLWNGDYRFKLGGHSVTLDHIEHGLIRGDNPSGFPKEMQRFKVKKLDPRIHSAVNCAAKSCPRVREKAYRGSNVNEVLDENMKEWLSNSEQFRKISQSKLYANSIVYWYYEDFDEHGKKELKLKGAGDYLSQFIDDQKNDGKWMKKHLKDSFNDRNKVFGLKLSNGYSFEYDWKVNDKRQK